MVIVKCLAICGFGTFSMLFPLTDDLKNDLKMINENAKRRRNRSKIVNQFSQFVPFHSKLVQLSSTQALSSSNFSQLTTNVFYFSLIHDYSDLLNLIFIIMFTWSIAGVCSLMLMLNMTVKYFELFINQIKLLIN